MVHLRWIYDKMVHPHEMFIIHDKYSLYPLEIYSLFMVLFYRDFLKICAVLLCEIALYFVPVPLLCSCLLTELLLYAFSDISS